MGNCGPRGVQSVEKRGFCATQLAFRSCGPMDIENLTLDDEDMDPDIMYVEVKLFADLARIKVWFAIGSRDVRFEESPVLSASASIRTGEWLSSHDVFPTTKQFNKGLKMCLHMVGLGAWCETDDEDSEEDENEDDESEHKQAKKTGKGTQRTQLKRGPKLAKGPSTKRACVR